jgi:hypothetical protein
LGALARYWGQWIRDPEEWAPGRHRALRQFSSLSRHLLCKYDVPRFMDSAFLSGDGETAEQQQGWFLHIGTGGNIRKADIPLRLTKKMAHLFLEAPASFSILGAFRFGQVLGMGGSEPLARAVIGSRLGQSFEDETSWVTVVQFFVNHPMLDPDHVGPIVDYIHGQKFAVREVERPDGTVVQEGPPRPNFAMKARSVDKLVREVDSWHRELARESRLPQRSWEPSGFGEIEKPLEDEPSLKWAVRELLSTKELQKEGRAMHHCVGSYAGNCMKGKVSIWSLRVEDTEDRAYPVMTIAVNGKRVTQARGKCNARPGGKRETQKQAGLERRYMEFLRRSRLVLQDWMRQEGLTMSGY